MRKYGRVERGDTAHFEYNPVIKQYQLRIPGPIRGMLSKDEYLRQYEEKYGPVSYLSQNPAVIGTISQPIQPAPVSPRDKNAGSKLSDLCQIADGRNFTNHFYYGNTETNFRMKLKSKQLPINIDVLRGEVPEWSLASVPSPILTIPLKSLTDGPDTNIAAEQSAIDIVTRTLYTLTCPYNPIEVVLENQKVMISDFPNGPIHSILIELRQPVYNVLTAPFGNVFANEEDNRPSEKPGWAAMSITVFVNDPSFLAEIHALLPNGKIQSEACSLLPRIVLDSDALQLGTEVNILSQCMQNIHAYLTAGRYLDNPVKLPFIPFPAELITHFNKTLSDYAALIVAPFLKIEPDGIEHHARYSYMTPQDQLLSNLAPYHLSYTFNPKQHEKMPDGLTPLISALLFNDINRFHQILAEDPSQITARDAWGRTPLKIAMLMYGAQLNRGDLARMIIKILRDQNKMGLHTLISNSMLLSNPTMSFINLREHDLAANLTIVHLTNMGKPVPQRPELHKAIIARNNMPNPMKRALILQQIVKLLQNSQPTAMIQPKLFATIPQAEPTACVNQPDSWGFYPIMIAAAYGDEEVVCALIKAGANINPPETKDDCHNEWAYDVLECAVESGNPAVVKMLLQHSVAIKSARPVQIAFKKAVIAAENNDQNGELAFLRVIKLLLRYGGVYGTFLSGLHPIKIAIELANRGKPKLLGTLLDHTNAFVATAQKTGLAIEAALSLDGHNTVKASRFFTERVNTPKIVGLSLQNHGRRIVTKLIDPRLKRELEKKELSIEGAFLYANHQLVKDLTEKEMSQMQELFFKNFEFNPNVTFNPNAVSDLFSGQDNDLLVEYFTHDGDVKSFFIYKVTKEEDPKLGEFIWFRLLLAASDFEFAGKGLARFLVERIPFMLKNIYPTLPIIVTSVSIAPWYGFMVSPNQVYPKQFIDPDLANRLVNRMNAHLVAANSLPGVVNENLFISKTQFNSKKASDPNYQMALELTQGQQLPLAVIFEADQHCHIYSANAYYRGITPDYMAKLTKIWEPFIQTISGKPAAKL